MSEPCEVHEYSIERLLDLFEKKPKASCHEVRAKLHTIYFRDYFACIGAKTIVVENEYVDRDYLEDYAEYYVRCFREYPRKCTRLHFFKLAFTHEDFDNCLVKRSDWLTPELLQEHYLGFIVLKPLPRTIIGRTCLITYPPEGRRFFPATRCYDANLFGLCLKVKNSLAFQEQDSVVAACATSALWSIFQATGQLFQHQIPSPSAITNNATEILTTERRALPSPGLTPLEMAHAIKSVGLEPFHVNVGNHYWLKAIVYAYLRAGIPMMLGFHLIDVSNLEPRYIGKHAVAITGYSLGYTDPKPFENTGFLLKAARIDKIYAHDDQVGPFSRMVIDGQIIKDTDGKMSPSILTSWQGDNGDIGGRRAISEILLIPLYHKIRIPFGTIHDIVFDFDLSLKNIISAVAVDLFPQYQKFEWDIYLVSVNALKEDVFRSNDIGEKSRRELLLQSLPRYLWRASLLVDSSFMLDLLFDATDIEQGEFFVRAIEHDGDITESLQILFRVEAIQTSFEATPLWPIIRWFRKYERAG